jgi:hypothetical protein
LRIEERFVDKERKGHYEGNFICTLLDPRFKLLNFNGSTKAMKKDAETYLKANYKSDYWSPKARNANVLVTPAPADKVGNSFIPAPTLSLPQKNSIKRRYIPIIF